MSKKSLDKQTALVLGGAGEVGEGIVRAFLRDGWQVIVPSRSEARLEDLREHVRNAGQGSLQTITSNVSDVYEARQLRDELKQQYGSLQAVVASIGGWWQGSRIIEVPIETWQKVYADNLLSHFIAVTSFYSLLAHQPESCYLFINGSAAQEAAPMAGPSSIFSAAKLMLSNVMDAEEKPSGPRTDTLMINTPVESRSRHHHNPAYLTADEIGAVAAHVCSGRGVEFRGQTIQLSTHDDVQQIVAAALKK